MSTAAKNPTPAQEPGGGGAARAARRPWTMREYRLIRAHYRDCSAAELAQRLGRTRQSVYAFLTRHPELRKFGRP